METKSEIVFIDDALAETKFGRFNYFIILISGLIMLNVVIECLGMSFVLPVINCDMDLTYQQKGFLGAVTFLGMISSSHLWGFLADTTGRRKVIRPTLLAGYFVTVISSFSPNFWTLLILRFINGFIVCGGSATVFAYLGEFHSKKLRNRAIMSAALVSAFTATLLPILAWAVINKHWSFEVPILNFTYKPWRLCILLLGTMGLVSGLSLFFIPESPKYLLYAGKEDDAIRVLRKMYSINTGNSRDSFNIRSIKPDNEEIQRYKVKNGKNLTIILKSMWKQTVPLFMPEHCRKTLLACFIQFWVFYSAHGVYMWLPFIVDKVMLYTKANPNARLDICDMIYYMEENVHRLNGTNGALEIKSSCMEVLEPSTYKHTLAFEVMFFCVFLGSGYFTGKLGRTPTLFFLLFICGACEVLSSVVTIPLVAVYLLMIALVCGIGTSIVNVITVDTFPTNLRAMAVCISLMMGRIGSVTGTNVSGVLLEHHCKTSLLTAGIPLIVCAFLSLLLPSGESPKKTKNNNDDVS